MAQAAPEVHDIAAVDDAGSALEEVGAGYSPLWRLLVAKLTLRDPKRADTGTFALLTTLDEMLGMEGDTVFAPRATIAEWSGASLTTTDDRLAAAVALGLLEKRAGARGYPVYVRTFPGSREAAQSVIDEDMAARKVASAQTRARKADGERIRREARTTSRPPSRPAPRLEPHAIPPQPRPIAAEPTVAGPVAEVTPLGEAREAAWKAGKKRRVRAARVIRSCCNHRRLSVKTREYLANVDNRDEEFWPVRNALADVFEAYPDLSNYDAADAVVDALKYGMDTARDSDEDYTWTVVNRYAAADLADFTLYQSPKPPF